MVDGREWHRFMDSIFTPVPAFLLSPSQVVQLCEIRVAGLLVSDKCIYAAVSRAVLERMRTVSFGGDRILDFGAGDGRAYRDLLTLDESRVVQVDASFDSLRRNPEANRVLVDPCGPLPFASGSFDLCRGLFVMHFGVPGPMLREIRRCLKHGGHCVVNFYGPFGEAHRLAMRSAGFELAYEEEIHGAQKHELEDWIAGR